jgi:hypothetical protein
MTDRERKAPGRPILLADLRDTTLLGTQDGRNAFLARERLLEVALVGMNS